MRTRAHKSGRAPPGRISRDRHGSSGTVARKGHGRLAFGIAKIAPLRSRPVVRRGRRVVFVEVKAKTDATFVDPVEMVGPEKQRRLRRAAESWLAAHPELDGLEITFDVVAERAGRLERRADAF